jgi:hypothetical protein
MTHRPFLLILIAALPALLPGQTFPPTQDAYVVPGNATNFGTAPNITVGNTQAQGLLQFDMTELPGGITTNQVSKAMLTLYANSVGAPGAISVYAASGAWTESAVNGTNAPIAGAPVTLNVSVPATAKGNYLAIDVTTAVQAWVSGSPNNGFLILASSGTSVQFDSKENTTTSHPPSLAVSLNLGPIAYAVGGSVVNLNNNGLQLQMNAGPVLSVPGGSSTFAFPGPMYNGQSFQAALVQQPANQTCTLGVNTGTIANANGNVSVNCISAPTVAPTNVTATGTTAICQDFLEHCGNIYAQLGSVALTWTAPTPSANNPVTGYNITASPSGATITSSGTSVTFGGLPVYDGSHNRIKWSFTVAATNALGVSPPSAPSNIISAPGPLSNFHFIRYFYNCTTQPNYIDEAVAWDPPADPGSAGPVVMRGDLQATAGGTPYPVSTFWGSATQVNIYSTGACGAIFYAAAANQFGIGPTN